MMVEPPLGPITLPNWDQGPTVDLMTWRAWGGGVGWVAGQGRVHRCLTQLFHTDSAVCCPPTHEGLQRPHPIDKRLPA